MRQLTQVFLFCRRKPVHGASISRPFQTKARVPPCRGGPHLPSGPSQEECVNPRCGQTPFLSPERSAREDGERWTHDYNLLWDLLGWGQSRVIMLHSENFWNEIWHRMGWMVPPPLNNPGMNKCTTHFRHYKELQYVIPIVHSPLNTSAWSFVFFFFFFFFYFIFFNLFFAALGLCCCAWVFSSCGERGLLFVAVHGLYARGLQ